jgi:hypothetical protein
MPLSRAGRDVMRSMKKTYGSEKEAKEVFYASVNAKKPESKKWEKKH